jgi:indolepyruvate ferredoxin oxidoreductase, alpha subunit
MKKILLGNEAIVQGALEAGVQFVSAYPGTPSSEIGDKFSQIAKDNGIYFEFSTNEKVAMEAAIGASFSGMKTLVSMKNFGLNVASDSLLPFVYTGTVGPTVIVVADDPSCYSSGQSEENTRPFGDLAHIPILEPADAQEAKDFTKLGFEISEKFSIPVILRITTRVAHQRMPVEVGEVKIERKEGLFVKNKDKFVTMPPRVMEMKGELLKKLKEIANFGDKNTANRIEKAVGRVGIITSGVSYLYVKEALEDLELKVPVLKIGFFNPLPARKIKAFIKELKKVLVVEELEGYIEREISLLARESNCKLEIHGKDLLPVIGELNTEKVVLAMAKLFGIKYKIEKKKEVVIPKRFPRLCQGCPYWLVFGTIKRMAPEGTIFGGDIGCYMLAGYSPHEIQDYLLCMGSSIGIGHGIKKASQNKQKLISLIGDGTFFHAGIPALINSVYNKSNLLVIILDNRITAMTGHQPNAGMQKTGMGERAEDIKIEDIVKACGVKHVSVIDPISVTDMELTIKEYLEKQETSVIIMRRMCAYLARKLNK